MVSCNLDTGIVVEQQPYEYHSHFYAKRDYYLRTKAGLATCTAFDQRRDSITERETPDIVFF